LGTTAAGGTGGHGCSTFWNCTAWGSCFNGIQTRVCSKDREYCSAKEAKPSEQQNCTVPATLVQPPVAEPIAEEEMPSIIEEEMPEAAKDYFTAMLIAAVIGIILIAAALFIILLLRHASRKAALAKIRKRKNWQQ
jgi:hypothetical protein